MRYPRAIQPAFEQALFNTYFWRTYDGQEIDYLEEEGGKLVGFECKWGSRKWRVPSTFISAYPGNEVHLVKRENMLEFL